MTTPSPRPKLYSPLHRAIRSLPLLAVILSSGCAMTGPDFKTPDAQVADEWAGKDTAGINNQPATASEWWKIFNDPVLNALVEIAKE